MFYIYNTFFADYINNNKYYKYVRFLDISFLQKQVLIIYILMGFWSFVWGGIKSTCSFVGSCVSTVVSSTVSVVKAVVNTTASVVKTVASTAVSAVKAVASTVQNVATAIYDTGKTIVNKVGGWIDKTKTFLTDKWNETKNWFMNTSIGKGITKAKDWLMNDTFIGKGIKWIKKKVEDGCDYFFNETSLGRGIKNTFQAISNSAIGKFVNDWVAPVVSIASWVAPALGLTGKIFNSIVSGAKTIVNASKIIKDFPSVAKKYLTSGFEIAGNFVTKKFTQLKQKVVNSSFLQKANNVYQNYKTKVQSTYNKTKQYIKNSSFYQGGVAIVTNVYQKAQSIVQKTKNIYHSIQEKISNHPLAQKVTNGLNNLKEKAKPYVQKAMQKSTPLINYLKSKGTQYAPTFVKYGFKGYNTLKDYANDLTKAAIKKSKEIYQPYLYRFQRTKAGKALNITGKILNYGIIKPSTWVFKNTAGRAFSWLKDKTKQKIEATSIYKSIVETSNKIGDIRSSSIVKQNFSKTIEEEKKSKGLSSEAMLSSYFQKYRGKIDKKSQIQALSKINQKFEKISQQKKTNEKLETTEGCSKPLNCFLQSSQIQLQSIKFNSRGTEHKESSIGGEITLKNLTGEPKQFEVPSGTLFGCKKMRSSQHVVVKKMEGMLEGHQSKTFKLNGFCADSSLKWPYNDSNYDITAFKLKNYNENLSQSQIWSMTH